MEVVSLKPFFRASHFYLRKSNRPECSHFSLHSKLSLRRRPSPRKPQKFRALASRSDPNEPWNNPFSLFLPILVSRVPKLSPFLLGGRGRGAGGEDYARSGGIGLVLMSTSAAAVAKSRVSPFLCTLAGNPTFVSGLMAWALAQTLKMLLNFFVERRWDFGMLFSSGGMPSSHSALCMALTASVALCHGVSDALFPVCLGFSLIVMYDAIGVRRHAGMQAEVLNKIIEDLFQGHPISERKLKELLGHTPSQVVAGAVLGILVACICCQGFVVSV